MKKIDFKGVSRYEFLNATHKELTNTLFFVRFSEHERKDGTISYNTNVLEAATYNETFSKVKNVRNILSTIIAHYIETNDIQDLFHVVYNSDKYTKENGEIKLMNVVSISSFLATTEIYFCDADGRVNTYMISDVKFSQTALKITKDMNIISCSRNKRDEILNAQAKLICRQSMFTTLVTNRANAMSSNKESVTKVETNDKVGVFVG